MWCPKLSIQDRPNKDTPERGILKIAYWCREHRKYVYVSTRYGFKKSKDKAYEIMREKQAELKTKLTYDGNDKIMQPKDTR